MIGIRGSVQFLENRNKSNSETCDLSWKYLYIHVTNTEMLVQL